MKRLIVIVAACIAMCSAAEAQNLGNFLKNAAKTVVNEAVDKYVGVSLPGSWTYTGVGIKLKSDNMLSEMAGNALISSTESKMDSYLKKIGLTSGSMKFTFAEDYTFSCTVKNIPMGGTWKLSEDGKTLTLKYGKTLKYLSMTGELASTTEGCEVLFEADKFLDFVKTAMSYANKAKGGNGSSAISSLAGNYKDLKIGYKLRKN